MTKRTALIVGGNGVLGRRLVAALASDHRLAATWHREEPTADLASQCSFYRLDVTSPELVASAVRKIELELDGIDTLINCAGVFRGGLLQFTAEDQWQQVLDVNLTGVFNVCRAVAPRMVDRRRGNIINVASARALDPGPGEAAYAASKAGVIAFTKSLARELAARGVRVNAVCPGFISSGLNRFDPKIRAREEGAALMGVEHNLDDFAAFVRFLCSDQLQAVTGQVFHVDSRVS